MTAPRGAAVTACLAIDAGGTSTRALLITPDGECLGYGRAGGGNPVSWGPEAAARSVASAVVSAVSGSVGSGAGSVAGAEPRHLLGPAVMAMAGASAAPTPDGWTAVLAGVGIAASVVYESDLLATFCAGTPELDGYAVVAGTGASAIRVVGGAVEGTADGLGWLLGDGGSGFWIGQRAVRAALAALDRRGPDTALTPLLLEALDVRSDEPGVKDGRPESLRQAVDALYRMRPVELSRFAAPALSAAASGDVVASGILAEAQRRLVGALSAVYRPGHRGPVVLGGGIARRLPGFAAAVADAVRSWGEPDPLVAEVEDGSVGAGVLALRHAGIGVDRAVFDRLSASLAERRGVDG